LANNVAINPAKFYGLPFLARHTAYRRLYSQAFESRAAKIEPFRKHHGRSSGTEQLKILMPDIEWRNSKVIGQAKDALCYEIPDDLMAEIEQPTLWGRITGSVILSDKQFDPKYKHLAGHVIISTRPRHGNPPLFILDHELDHLRHIGLPAYAMATMEGEKYLGLIPSFVEAFKKTTGREFGMFNDTLFVSGQNLVGPTNRPGEEGSGKAPEEAYQITDTLIKMLAYQMLFETSAVFRSFAPDWQNIANNDEKRISVLEEIKDCNKNGQTYGFNLNFIRQNFHYDKELVETINSFDNWSIYFIGHMAMLIKELENKAGEVNLMNALATAMQISVYSEVGEDFHTLVNNTIISYESQKGKMSLIGD